MLEIGVLAKTGLQSFSEELFFNMVVSKRIMIDVYSMNNCKYEHYEKERKLIHLYNTLALGRFRTLE